MTSNEAIKEIQGSKVIVGETIQLFQRNITSEASQWLKAVEATAKQKKTGKIVLIAVLKDA